MYSSDDDRRRYFRERYKAKKLLAIKLLGSKCAKCGSTENLELDHIDPDSKAYEFSHLYNLCEMAFRRELTKCQLLCEKHHVEKSASELKLAICKRGHPRTKENITNRRVCRLCMRELAPYYKNKNKVGRILAGIK